MRKMTSIPNHLRLWVPKIPNSYQGNLYCILGPGLGDTVNDFRILHELRKYYSFATFITYVDPRWKGLYELIPEVEKLTLRFYEEAPSGQHSPSRHKKPYYRTFHSLVHEICQEIESKPGYVALASFCCPDQLAKKESSISMKARAIGLPMSREQRRPFLPFPERYEADVQRVLQSKGMISGEYCVVAPHTFPDKMWVDESWEYVMTECVEKLSIPVLLVGLPGYPSLCQVVVQEALGLPLHIVAGLISKARCFIGLDSGLTHLAASYDIPIITLNPQGKFPPFLIEVQSPMRWTHLTPGIYGSQTIPYESVLAIVKRALQEGTPEGCPLCSEIPYVLIGKNDKRLFLCRCGLVFLSPSITRHGQATIDRSEEMISLPRHVSDLRAFQDWLNQQREQALEREGAADIRVHFEHWRLTGTDPDTFLSCGPEQDVWWTWDAVYHVLSKNGWHVMESRGQPASRGQGFLYSFTIRAISIGWEDTDPALQRPWGARLVWFRRSLCERWLCWESFERNNELEALGWMLVNEGFERDGRDILRFVATLGLRGRTIGRVIRSELKALVAGFRNSSKTVAEVP